jgi:hypothetical protein
VDAFESNEEEDVDPLHGTSQKPSKNMKRPQSRHPQARKALNDVLNLKPKKVLTPGAKNPNVKKTKVGIANAKSKASSVPTITQPKKCILTKTVPTKTVPTKTVPTTVPSKTVPAKTVPTKTVTTKTVPTKTAPTKNVPKVFGDNVVGQPSTSKLNEIEQVEDSVMTANQKVSDWIQNLPNEKVPETSKADLQVQSLKPAVKLTNPAPKSLKLRKKSSNPAPKALKAASKLAPKTAPPPAKPKHKPEAISSKPNSSQQMSSSSLSTYSDLVKAGPSGMFKMGRGSKCLQEHNKQGTGKNGNNVAKNLFTDNLLIENQPKKVPMKPLQNLTMEDIENILDEERTPIRKR